MTKKNDEGARRQESDGGLNIQYYAFLASAIFF
jgi:hypothetical protein